MELRPLTADDIPLVAEAWNRFLPYDQVAEQRLRWGLLEDPNHEPEAVLIAQGPGGEVLGLSACALRRTPEGRDGGGSQEGFHRGYLKGFFAAEGPAGEKAAAALLVAAERYCAAAGKRELRVTEYTGPHFFPGLDVRYERLRRLLGDRGYRDVRTIEDVAADLRDPALEARLASAWERLGEAHDLCTWRPELLPAMRRFVAEGKMPAWFPLGWEKRYQEPRETTLILRRGEEIVGWAQYWPGAPRAAFGPILVLERERGRGYGGLLLLESMVRAQRSGCDHMDAGWANTGFYIAYGWQIVRRYAVLTKELGGRQS